MWQIQSVVQEIAHINIAKFSILKGYSLQDTFNVDDAYSNVTFSIRLFRLKANDVRVGKDLNCVVA